jgi:hypothetical protein
MCVVLGAMEAWTALLPLPPEPLCQFWIEEFYFREFYGKFAQSIIFKFVVNHD